LHLLARRATAVTGLQQVTLAEHHWGMRADPADFLELDLRCHSLLDDVPLHDVWAVSLEGGGPDRTMEDARAVTSLDRARPNVAVRSLFVLRRALGLVFRWDEDRDDWSAESYVDRLTDDDRARSSVVPGTQEGPFRTLYVFPDEALMEARNATVHGFLATALVPRPGGYLLYWAIYVKPVGAITRAYMALIDPFRRLFVYPALIGDVQGRWRHRYGAPTH
jgi:hypothetical protein